MLQNLKIVSYTKIACEQFGCSCKERIHPRFINVARMTCMRFNGKALITRLSAIILVLGALAAFAVTAYFLGKADWPTVTLPAIMTLFVAPLVLGIALVASLRLRADRRTVVAINLFAVAIALAVAEIYLQTIPPTRTSVEAYAAKLGNEFDPRDIRTVIRDLRSELGRAYGTAAGHHLLKTDESGMRRSPISLNGRELLPLAGPANHPAVFCNETGQWVWYQADEQGFNNPAGLWSQPVRILALGDSFTHGFCVPPGRNMVDVIRESEPRTLNAGIAGSGPLTMLAVLREFGPVVTPRRVLWIFYGNDMTDLEREKLSPLLLRYLRPDATRLQDLYNRKAAIDRTLTNHYDEKLSKTAPSPEEKPPDWWDRISWRDAALLRNLRKRLGIDIGGSRFDYPLLERVLKSAKSETAGWGGELTIVYLPEHVLFDGNTTMARYHRAINARLQDIARRLGLGWIDLTATFSAHPDPMSLYDTPNLHYSADGYRIAAEAILDGLGKGRQ